MTGTGTRLFHAILILCGGVAALGAALAVWGHFSQVYTVDFETASAAAQHWCTDQARVDDAAGDRYLALFGFHYARIDVGVTLVLGAVTVALLAVALRVTNGDSERHWLRTPRWRWAYLAIGLGVLASLYIATIASLSIDLDRRYFPWCADSIGIPISGIASLTMVLIPVLLIIGAMITLTFGALPAPLGQWDRARPLWSWFVTILWAVPALAIVAILVWQAPGSSSIETPPYLIAIYLLAATRAAMLAPRKAG